MLLRRILPRLFFAYLLLTVCQAVANVAPEYTAPAAAPVLRRSGTPKELDLKALFRDPDMPGSIVRVSARIGTATKPVDILLFDSTKPITVTNFLRYVNAG